MESSKKLLEDEIVISKLMGEPKSAIVMIDGMQTEVVVFDGIPLNLRLFMILVLNFGSGSKPEPVAMDKLSKEIEEFWELVGYQRPEESFRVDPQTADTGFLMSLFPKSVRDISKIRPSFQWVRDCIEDYLLINKGLELSKVLEKVVEELRLCHQDQHQRQSSDHQSKK
jgi:hypothetical protein